MKIRSGFVSNSSSSSFVVAFPRNVNTRNLSSNIPKELRRRMHVKQISLKEALFDDRNSNIEYYDYSFDINDIVEAVAQSIESETPNNIETIRELLGYELDDNSIEKFLKDNKDKDIYVFEYSDNDGPLQTMLEHGEIFKRLPHIRISHH